MVESTSRREKKPAAVCGVPALRVPMVHSKYTTFLLENQKTNARQRRGADSAPPRARARAATGRAQAGEAGGRAAAEPGRAGRAGGAFFLCPESQILCV